jgi:hypothetical protein
MRSKGQLNQSTYYGLCNFFISEPDVWNAAYNIREDKCEILQHKKRAHAHAHTKYVGNLPRISSYEEMNKTI